MNNNSRFIIMILIASVFEFIIHLLCNSCINKLDKNNDNDKPLITFYKIIIKIGLICGIIMIICSYMIIFKLQ